MHCTHTLVLGPTVGRVCRAFAQAGGTMTSVPHLPQRNSHTTPNMLHGGSQGRYNPSPRSERQSKRRECDPFIGLSHSFERHWQPHTGFRGCDRHPERFRIAPHLVVGVRRIRRVLENDFSHSPPFDGSFAFSIGHAGLHDRACALR